MKFEKTIIESIIPDKGINLGKMPGDDEDDFNFAFFYDITKNTQSQTEKEMKECLLGGPEYGNAIRFMIDNNEKRFIVFRPDCLHYKVASQLGIKYPLNDNVLFGSGWIKNPRSSMKIDDIEYATLSEMPRGKDAKKFLEKLLGDGKKWSWADKWGDVTEALFSSIMNKNYWSEYKKSHYEDDQRGR